MTEEKDFAVINIPDLRWPTSFRAPSNRFRLFVAADSVNISTDAISDFASGALNAGMVYLCAWGLGCERFHDTVDELVVEEEIGDGRFRGSTENDVIMTTWHDHESLQEALSFFATSARPTDGFTADSSFWFVVCVDNAQWAASAKQFLAQQSSLLNC